MIRDIPPAFDSVLKIEGEPTDEAVGKRLLEHVSIEAFANGKHEPGNYIIEVRTTLPDDLNERQRVAAELNIAIDDSAIPHLTSEFSEPLISRVGFELRNSILLRSRPIGAPPVNDMAHMLGIGAEWAREDREHLFRVRLSVGMTAVAQGLSWLGINHLETHEAPKAAYATEDLAQAVETGKLLVCGQPAADANEVAILLLPLHDNVFHLYSNILLQTPEFTTFVKKHRANRRPGELDGHLANAGAQLHCMSGSDWYMDTAVAQAPYRRFRRFLYGFIDPESSGAVQLNKEIEAMSAVDVLLAQEGELDDTAVASLSVNRAIMDCSGNMLDQLNPVVSSIISRFVTLVHHRSVDTSS